MTRISGSYTSAMFDERAVRENDKIIKLNQFLLSLNQYGLKGIITCNYDTLVECAFFAICNFLYFYYTNLTTPVNHLKICLEKQGHERTEIRRCPGFPYHL